LHRKWESRRIAPEILERVKGALFVVENVDDHIGVIGDDPLAEREAVDAPWADAVILAQPVLEFVDERLQVRLGIARADHKKISEARESAHIECDDVFGFFVRDNLRAKLGEVF
jgi:hypothetical protein